MKIKIFDLENDDAFSELFNLKSKKLIKSVNFIENIKNRECKIITSLSSINLDILFYGFTSLKLPLICAMNSKEKSCINFLTDCDDVLNKSLQYNYQDTEISLRTSTNEDRYFEEINSGNYGSKIKFASLKQNDFETSDLNFINLDRSYRENNIQYLLNLIKSKNQLCILISKNIENNENIINLNLKNIFSIRDTNINIVSFLDLSV